MEVDYPAWIAFAIWGIAAFMDSAMDKIQFHFDKSIFYGLNDDYWNPKRSWRNKHRYTGFMGKLMKGPLVFLTDGWHTLQFIKNSCIIICFVIYKMHYGWAANYWYLDFMLFMVVWGMVTHVSFHYLTDRLWWQQLFGKR